MDNSTTLIHKQAAANAEAATLLALFATARNAPHTPAVRTVSEAY